MINSVIKAIKIMQLFDESETRIRLAEISRRVEMPKSTVHNILNTLISEGFIEKVDGDLYALGMASLTLAQNIRVNVEIRDPAAPLLRALADYTHESVYLTIKDGDYCLYIYALESPRRLLARTAVGDRIPLHCTSLGKAMLAYLPEEEVEGIIGRMGLTAYTRNTITNMADLKEDLRKTAQRGYAMDNEEYEDNACCIGAPIFDRKCQVIGACSVSGQKNSFVDEKLPNNAEHLRYTAQEISRRMGYIPTAASLVTIPS